MMSSLKTAYRLINCEKEKERISRECVAAAMQSTLTAAISKK
jgi:hypothetical protein